MQAGVEFSMNMTVFVRGGLGEPGQWVLSMWVPQILVDVSEM